MGAVLGPQSHGPGDRPAGLGQPAERAFPRATAPGKEIEPSDLTLDAAHHPERPVLSVGADLSQMRVVPAGRGRMMMPQQGQGPPL